MNDNDLFEAARALELAEDMAWINEAANLKLPKSKNDDFRIYIRHSNEMVSDSKSSHFASIKCGVRNRLASVKLSDDFDMLTGRGYGEAPTEKRLVSAARRFAMDNIAALIAYWYDDDEVYEDVLLEYLNNKLAKIDYTKNSTISAPKSPKEIEKDKKELVEFVEKKMGVKYKGLEFGNL